jgi:hypothetical protein
MESKINNKKTDRIGVLVEEEKKERKKREDRKIRKTVKQYTDTYIEKHKNNNICDLCLGHFTPLNKWHHLKTIKHMNALRFKQLEEEINLLKSNNN